MESRVKKYVRDRYATIAKQGSSCCAPVNPCCRGVHVEDVSKRVGYTEEELRAVPGGANLGLGCGNPVALASLREGETVMDLGSGAGFDCFLAANKVGKSGRVIGVDMTPDMVEKARQNAEKGHYENVEFILAEIENLPAADNSVDVVISNCVINLAQDKGRVFKEAFRVLKPGGRLMISDIVLLKKLPDFMENSIEAYVGCLSGAIMKDEYLASMKAAGFQKIEIMDEASSSNMLSDMVDNPEIKEIIEDLRIAPEGLKKLANSAVSISVCGLKMRHTD
ncbi:MAG: arsenite methyltransferase [Candidatus Bathyarchaeia archaeon]